MNFRNKRLIMKLRRESYTLSHCIFLQYMNYSPALRVLNTRCAFIK
jgi:hypothetical protein